MDYTGNTLRYNVYKSKLWKKTRIAYAMSKNCICERCGKAIYMTGTMQYLPKEKRKKGIVHHKIHLNEKNYMDDNIAYNWDNLELLCIDCHNIIHSSLPTRDDVMFDEDGNLKPR